MTPKIHHFCHSVGGDFGVLRSDDAREKSFFPRIRGRWVGELPVNGMQAGEVQQHSRARWRFRLRTLHDVSCQWMRHIRYGFWGEERRGQDVPNGKECTGLFSPFEEGEEANGAGEEANGAADEEERSEAERNGEQLKCRNAVTGASSVE